MGDEELSMNRKSVAWILILLDLILSVAQFSFAAAEADHEVSPVRSESPAPAEKAKGGGDPDRVLLVLFSGFNSCDDDSFLGSLSEGLQTSLGDKLPRKKLDVIRYCYEKTSGTVRVRLPGAQAFRAGRTDLRAALIELGERQKDYGSTLAVGHSWGGWSLLEAIQGMEKPKLLNPNPKGGEDANPFSDAVHDGWSEGARDAQEGRPAKRDPRSEETIAADEGLGAGDTQGGYWLGYEEGYEQAKIAKDTPAVPPLNVSLLVTIDPINGERGTGCNPGALITGMKVCQEFPADIDPAAVDARPGRWLNYFQDADSRLHSGAVPADNPIALQRLAGNHGTLKEDPRLRREVIDAAVGILN
jgi:hypothetical protein